MKKICFFFIAATIIIACNQPAGTKDVAGSFNLDSAKAAIVAANNLFSEAIAKGDSTAASALYSKDACIMQAIDDVTDHFKISKTHTCIFFLQIKPAKCTCKPTLKGVISNKFCKPALLISPAFYFVTCVQTIYDPLFTWLHFCY